MSSKFARSLFTVLVLVIVATTLFACGGGAKPAPTAAPAQPAATTAPAAAPANKALVGVILPTKDEPRWLQDQAVFQKAGWEPLFSQGDSAKEKANVEALISQGVKVIIITPQDATAAAAAAEAAKAAGFKIIS
jgi:putative multiple sugar transport system substrate-binding protein